MNSRLAAQHRRCSVQEGRAAQHAVPVSSRHHTKGECEQHVDRLRRPLREENGAQQHGKYRRRDARIEQKTDPFKQHRNTDDQQQHEHLFAGSEQFRLP